MTASLLSAPMWTDKVTAIATAAGTAVVLVSAVLALVGSRNQLEDAKRTRHGQLLNDFSRRWDEDLLRKSRIALNESTPQQVLELAKKVYARKATEAERDTFYETMGALPNFLEALAVQVELKALSIDPVNRLWGQATLMAWDRWELAVVHIRGTSVAANQTYVRLQNLARLIREARGLPPPDEEDEGQSSKVPAAESPPVQGSGADPGAPG